MGHESELWAPLLFHRWRISSHDIPILCIDHRSCPLPLLKRSARFFHFSNLTFPFEVKFEVGAKKFDDSEDPPSISVSNRKMHSGMFGEMKKFNYIFFS